jgi:glycosyltransferase involved in cell wall biosynthesis
LRSREGKIDVSVVLAVYDEAGHLEEEIKRIRAALEVSPYSFEIIVVDDGSTDGSGEILQTMEGIRLIRFAHNHGSGTARKHGTHLARGRVVVWTDVDMSYPNEEIPRLVKELDGYDQVVGARTSEHGTAKALRVPAKWFIRKLAGYLTETEIPDLNSGLRAFRRDVAWQFLHLLPKGFSCVTTLTMSFLNNGYSIRYVPIEYSERAGNSKFHWWTDTRQYLLQVVRMVLMYNPLKVFMPVTVWLFAIGLGKLAFDVVTKDFRVATNTLLIFFAAFASLLVALLSDVIVQLSKPRDGAEPAALFMNDPKAQSGADAAKDMSLGG